MLCQGRRDLEQNGQADGSNNRRVDQIVVRWVCGSDREKVDGPMVVRKISGDESKDKSALVISLSVFLHYPEGGPKMKHTTKRSSRRKSWDGENS